MTLPLWLTAASADDDRAEHPLSDSTGGEPHRDRAHQLPVAEQALIERLRGGDPAAMTELVVTHFDGLARYADCLLRSRDDAEDVAQDVLAHVWNNRQRWTPHTTIRIYLLGAVRNRVIDFRRRLDAGARRAVLIDAPSPIPLPDRSLLDSEDAAALQSAIDRLPSRWREVIALRYEQQIAFRDVGRILGISEDAAKKLAQRAIGELRRALGV